MKTADWKKAIGQQLALERREIGKTQADIKDALGVSIKTISHIENGKSPTLEHYIKYSSFVGLDFSIVVHRARTVLLSR